MGASAGSAKGSSDALTGVSTLSSPSLPTGLFARQEAGDRKLVHSNVRAPPAPDAQPATSTPPSGARPSQARDCWPHSSWIGCTTTPTASPSTAPLTRRLGRGQTRQKSCMPAPEKRRIWTSEYVCQRLLQVASMCQSTVALLRLSATDTYAQPKIAYAFAWCHSPRVPFALRLTGATPIACVLRARPCDSKHCRVGAWP
jgi:hypothetical protein